MKQNESERTAIHQDWIGAKSLSIGFGAVQLGGVIGVYRTKMILGSIKAVMTEVLHSILLRLTVRAF